MFGYRVNFVKKQMRTKVPKAETSQAHKPLAKFVNEVTNLLTRDYPQIQKYHTKQRILVPVNSESEEEEEEEIEVESPISLKSPQIKRKQVEESDDEFDDGKESPEQLEDTQTNLKNKLKKKHKGELITVKLRNGDRQTYRKRCRNLMWKVGPPERQSSATSNARRGIQRGKTTETLGSPTKTTSTSPKKLGKDPKDLNSNQVMHGIRHLNIVRYQNPRQGQSMANNSQKPKHDPNHTTQYGGSYLKRQHSGNRAAGQQFERKDSAKGGRRLRASGENKNSEYYEGNDREVQQITNGQENQSTVYLMDSQAQKKNPRPQDHRNGNLINPGILPKDPSLMKPGESQTLVIELSEEQTRLLEAGQLTANGVPIPKDLNKLTYEQIIALLNSLSLPVEVSKNRGESGQAKTQQTPHSNITSRQSKMQNSTKYKQSSLNTTNSNLTSHPMGSDKKSYLQNDGGVLNSASFINIKRTGIYTNSQSKNDAKNRQGKQRPESSKRSRQHKPGSFYDEDMKHANQRAANNPSHLQKTKNYTGMNPQAGKAMGEPERNMLQNVNRQQQQLLNAQQYKQQSLNFEQARKMNNQAQPNFHQTIMGQQRVSGPVPAVQKTQQSINGHTGFVQGQKQAGNTAMPVLTNAQKRQDAYGEVPQNSNHPSNQNKNNTEQAKPSMTRLGSKRRLNNQKKGSNSDPQQITQKNLFHNMNGANGNSSARQGSQTKSAQQTKHQQQQLVQLSSYNYQETSTQKSVVTGRFDDRNKSQQPMTTHAVYNDTKSMGNTISPFNQGSAAMSQTGTQQAKSTDGSSNQQALSSLNRYYQSLNQGSSSSQTHPEVSRQHPPQLSQSTKNKSSKKTISLDDSSIEVRNPNQGASGKNQANSSKASKQPYQQSSRDKMNHSKMGQTAQHSSQTQPVTNRAATQGSVKQITGPCTQYYNKLNEQESQLTAYRMRISQTHMNNSNNQNLAQKRKTESALTSSAIQAIQQPRQAQVATNFKAARENQANYMRSFVPVDQRHQGDSIAKSNVVPQNNNFMHRSGEFKRNNGIQHYANTVGETSLMQRTAQASYKQGHAEYQSSSINSSSLKMPNGQKLVTMANAYGQASMTEITQNSQTLNSKPSPISNQMVESGKSSEMKQNPNPFAVKQFSKAGQAMNAAASLPVSSSQAKAAAQITSGNGSSLNSSAKAQPAQHL